MPVVCSCQPCCFTSPPSLHYSTKRTCSKEIPRSRNGVVSSPAVPPLSAGVRRRVGVFASQQFEKPVRLLRTRPAGLESLPSDLGSPADAAANGAAQAAVGAGAGVAQSLQQIIEDGTCLYVIRVTTGKEPFSGMSMPGGGVLLVVIGEDGDAISVQLQPQEEESNAQESRESERTEEREEEVGEFLANGLMPVVPKAFAAGQTAEVRLAAPSIGAVSAAWLAPPRGATWQVDSMSVTVIPAGASISSPVTPDLVVDSAEAEAASEQGDVTGAAAAAPPPPPPAAAAATAVQYTLLPGPFASTFLGDPSAGGGNRGNPDTPTAIQLRVATTQSLDPALALASPEATATAAEQARKAREDGLREYEELKRLLLLVTTALVVTGTGAAGWLGGADTAVAFAAGGAAAFVYLLRLQRRVDELPAPGWTETGESPSQSTLSKTSAAPADSSSSSRDTVEGRDNGGTNTTQLVRIIGVRAAVATLAIGSAVAVLGGTGGDDDVGLLSGGLQAVKIQPQLFVAGVLGFLTHKLAVIMVAFRTGHD